ARPAPRAGGAGRRDRLREPRTDRPPHPARVRRGGREREGLHAAHADRPAVPGRALDLARQRRVRARVPREVGQGRRAPRLRPRSAALRRGPHDRRAVRARPARAHRPRARRRPAPGARARALLRARRVSRARGGAAVGRGGRVKFVRLRVDGFGPLQGEWSFSPDRVNVVIDDNERGKSTLFAALAAGLYGLDGDRRSHRVVTPLERWRPWAGGAYRVTLDLESAEERFTITRDFERGTVAVFDRSGGEVTAQFLEGRDEYPVGKKLFGLDQSEFEKCALIMQGDMDG